MSKKVLNLVLLMALIIGIVVSVLLIGSKSFADEENASQNNDMQKYFCRLIVFDENSVSYEAMGLLVGDEGYMLLVDPGIILDDCLVTYSDGTHGIAEHIAFNQYYRTHVFKVMPPSKEGIQFYSQDPRRMLMRNVELVTSAEIIEANVFGPAKILGGIAFLIDKEADLGSLVCFNNQPVGIIISSSNRYATGITFQLLEPLFDEIRSTGTYNKPLLGVFMKNDGGQVFVVDVAKNSCAEKGGMKKGDILKKINGVDVGNSISVQEFVEKSKIGDQLKIDIIRDSKDMRLDVILYNI